MHIQIYSVNFFPEATGIGKYTGEMAAWFAQRGHLVSVLTGFPYYPEWKLGGEYRRTRFRSEHWEGVTIRRVPHYIPDGVRITSFKRMLIDLSFFAASAFDWLGILMRSRRPDVVIAICPSLLSGIWPGFVSKLRGVPWIYHIQDFQVDAAMRLGMLQGSGLGRLLYQLENRLIRTATGVSSISPAMCRRAVAKGAREEQVFELPNWSDIRAIRPISSDTPFRPGLSSNRAPIVVMYAGAMGRKQGLDLVLDAAERLRDDPRFCFALIGSGSDASRLQEEARGRALHNLRFLPVQPAASLNEMLGSADIHLVVQKAGAADLVMPSKLANIFAAGRAVVVTAEPATTLATTVQSANAGLVVPPQDLDALVDALRRLADDPQLRETFNRNARAYAEHHLDQDTILSRFEQRLLELISSKVPLLEPVVATPVDGGV